MVNKTPQTHKHSRYNNQKLQDFIMRFDSAKRARMLDVYQQSFKNHKQVCDEALAQKDPEALKSAAHNLKALFYMIEANEAGALAEKMEESLMSGNNDIAFDSIDPLKDHIDDVLQAMAELQDNL